MDTKTMNPVKKERGTAKSSEFRAFFIDQLKDMYWAEKHLHSELPKMRSAATDERLAAAFEKHIHASERHIENLEKIFKLMGHAPAFKRCDAMEGLLKEARSIIEETEKDSYTRDAGLILAAQKIEHYGIASYGTLRIFARHMDETEVRKLFESNLASNKEIDVNLTIIAEGHINELASEE